MKSNIRNSQPFVVPLVFGLSDFDSVRPKYYWVFETYMNFAYRNNYPIIAQENYFKEDILHLNQYYNDFTNNVENQVLLNETKNLYKKYSISNKETNIILSKERNRFIAETNLLLKLNPEYKILIENRLDRIEKDYKKKIEAIITWVSNPTLETIAKQRRMRIISQELSPIRNNLYNKDYNTTLCYFQFANKYDPNYCRQLYDTFLESIKKEDIQLFSRDELLALFLNTEDLDYIKSYKSSPQYEIGVDPSFKKDVFFEAYAKEDIRTTLKKIDRLFDPSEVSIRFHPNLEYSIGNSLWEKDSSAKSIYWVSKCRRIVSSVSNISFNAMMFGKTSYVLSEKMPFSFKSLQDLKWKDENVVDTLYLNFMLFGYFTHWNLILDPNYIRWRLSNPPILEIYKYNKDYVLQILGVQKREAPITLKHILKDVHNLEDTAIEDFVHYSNFKEITKLKKQAIEHQSKLKKQILKYQNELNRTKNLLKSNQLLVSTLKEQLFSKEEKILSLNAELSQIKEEFNNKSTHINKIENSKSYKMAKALSLAFNYLIPRDSIRRYLFMGLLLFIKKMLSLSIKVILSPFKLIYKLYPIKKHKRYLRMKIYSSRKLSSLLQTDKYSNYQNSVAHLVSKDGRILKEIRPLSHLNETIAVHLHLYYEDLLEEFYRYLSNIPYTFDLYVSVSESANIKKIKRKFRKITSLDKIEVKVSPNKGRDYGPMFALFGKQLKKYKYLYHIHSKKSLRTGKEQNEWRRHLLDPLLGSKENVMLTFQLMESENVSQIFADTYKDIPLWANTWLGDMPIAEKLYKQIGIILTDRYLDFSAGSMFLIKTSAIKKLFDLDLSWDDFEEEKGQDRGTIQYALERGITYLVSSGGNNFAIFDDKNKTFKLNHSSKNLEDYTSFTKESVLEKLSKFDVISFDIFDTLVTRKIYRPDKVFELIEEKLLEMNIFKKKKFVQLRKKSEEQVRKKKNYKGDCSIDEIYDEFEGLSKLKKDDVLKIKQLEIEMELKLSTPRRDMLDIYNSLLKMNKVIILVSDMYLTKECIEKILFKCGYKNYFDLIISSEIGFRKDDGSMYDYIFNKYNTKSIIHVGDNESSDIHNLVRMGRQCLYVAQGVKLFEISNYSLEENSPLSLDDSLIMGTTVNNSLFNSPFAVNNQKKSGLVTDKYSYGYSILGPIFLYFFIWFLQTISEDETILFLSREGYYLQKIFNIFKTKLNLPKTNTIESHYFLASRRALTVTNIENLFDITKILETPFTYGTLSQLFYYRLGIDIDPKDDKIINIPQDIDIAIDTAKKYINKILANSKAEKINYLKYINSTIPNYQKRKISIVDLGYSGTTQYELNRLLKENITGYYFCVSSNKKPLSVGCKMFSCFNNNIFDEDLESNIIYKYSLLLESFLTAPHGQLIRFITDVETNNIRPEFLKEEANVSESFQESNIIFSGISDYINDIIELKGDLILEMKITKKYILNIFEKFVEELATEGHPLAKNLTLEDTYCGDPMRNVVDIINRNRLKK